MEHNRACFVCETPYHLMNAINFVINQADFELTTFDLFLRSEHYLPDSILKNLEEHHIFANVYQYSYTAGDFGSSDLLSKLRNIVNPNAVIRKHIIAGGVPSKYDLLFYAYPTFMPIWLARANPKAKIYFYEDGSGNYANSIDLPKMIKKEKLRFLLRFSSNPWNRIYGIYVYNPNLCKSSVSKTILKLPDFSADEKTLRILKNVFNYKESTLYQQRKIVFLSQPADDIWDVNGMKSVNETIIKKISQTYSDQLVIRYHPRDNGTINGFACSDDYNNMWELICAKDIDNDSVLISLLSTAQMTPKLIFNKEPHIIFTFRLYESFQNRDIGFDLLADSFKKMYSSDKISVVYDADDIIRLIDKAMLQQG